MVVKKSYKDSLDSVFVANKNGLLFEWIQKYLRGEGSNHSLADHLIEKNPQTIELTKFSLEKLIRVMGPEEGMVFKEKAELWEKRVEGLVKKIKDGEKFPPLIVTDFWGPLQISDGSHRHEALLRCGYEDYWILYVK